MFEKTALKITCWMVKNNIIALDRKIVVKWGIRNILDTIFNLTTFLIMGFLMSMVTETIIFTLGYIPLRSYAGGYHAKNTFRCWVVSNLLLFVAMKMICCIKKFTLIYVLLAVICVCVLIILMPVPDVNKPLNGNDKYKYKLLGNIILIIQIAIAIIFYFVGLKTLLYCFFSVWILLAMMLILGKLKNKKKQILT